MTAILMLVHLGLGCKKPVQETTPPIKDNSVEETVQEEPKKELPPSLPEEILELSTNFQKVFFELDSYILSEPSQVALAENVQILQDHLGIRIEIQGHADERGTTDYNLVLGQQRAETVSTYLNVSGVAASRLKVVSYGEERPLNSSNSEQAFTQNRRCEFVIIWRGDSPVMGSDEAEEGETTNESPSESKE